MKTGGLVEAVPAPAAGLMYPGMFAGAPEVSLTRRSLPTSDSLVDGSQRPETEPCRLSLDEALRNPSLVASESIATMHLRKVGGRGATGSLAIGMRMGGWVGGWPSPDVGGGHST